jgi:hypothetical protein
MIKMKGSIFRNMITPVFNGFYQLYQFVTEVLFIIMISNKVRLEENAGILSFFE